jgi:hypothetical protein
LFGPLKYHLSAEHFPDDKAEEREVTAWFRQQPKEFYADGFQGLVKRWDKCLNYREIMLRSKSIFQISTLICLSSISICNLLIDLPSYYRFQHEKQLLLESHMSSLSRVLTPFFLERVLQWGKELTSSIKHCFPKYEVRWAVHSLATHSVIKCLTKKLIQLSSLIKRKVSQTQQLQSFTMRLIKASVAMTLDEEFHLNNIKPNTSNNGRARNPSHFISYSMQDEYFSILNNQNIYTPYKITVSGELDERIRPVRFENNASLFVPSVY